MAKICPVCNKEIGFWQVDLGDVTVHAGCEARYLQDPEKYGGTVKTEPLTKEEKEAVEQRNQRRKEQQQEQEEKALHKSVYIKGGVDIKSFDMPFVDMVGFMIKWALASIPAFIILAFIGAIFFAMFGALFVSTR